VRGKQKERMLHVTVRTLNIFQSEETLLGR